MARPPGRRPRPAARARLLRRGGADPRPEHRRQHHDVQRRARDPAAAARLRRPRRPRRRAARGPLPRGAGQLPRLARPDALVQRDGRGRDVEPQSGAGHRRRARQGTARLTGDAAPPRRRAAAWPAAGDGRRRGGGAADGGDRPPPVAAAVRRRLRHRRAGDAPRWRVLHRRRCHAAALHVRAVLGDGVGALGAAPARWPARQPGRQQPADLRPAEARRRPGRRPGRRRPRDRAAGADVPGDEPRRAGRAR